MDSLTFIGGPFNGEDLSANDLMNMGAMVVMPGPASYYVDRDGAAKYAVDQERAAKILYDNECRLFGGRFAGRSVRASDVIPCGRSNMVTIDGVTEYYLLIANPRNGAALLVHDIVFVHPPLDAKTIIKRNGGDPFADTIADVEIVSENGAQEPV